MARRRASRAGSARLAKLVGAVLIALALASGALLAWPALRGRAGADIMLYGAILVLVISFLPQGIVGLARERSARADRR